MTEILDHYDLMEGLEQKGDALTGPCLGTRKTLNEYFMLFSTAEGRPPRNSSMYFATDCAEEDASDSATGVSRRNCRWRSIRR